MPRTETAEDAVVATCPTARGAGAPLVRLCPRPVGLAPSGGRVAVTTYGQAMPGSSGWYADLSFMVRTVFGHHGPVKYVPDFAPFPIGVDP